MSNNIENLDGIVSKLKEQGIEAGEKEKQRIIEEAKKAAQTIISEAEASSKQIIDEANSKAAQMEKNSQSAIAQASRDMVESTKVAVLDHLKSVFGKECESIFTQKEYLENLLKSVLDSIAGDKTVELPADTVKAMEAYIMKQSLSEKIELKPLAGSAAKIVVNSTEKEGVQLVLSSEDVEDALFSLLNKDLVKRITQKKEE